MRGDANLLPYVETRVTGHTLVLATRRHANLRPRAGLSVLVRLPELRRLEAHGASRVVASGLRGPSLVLLLTGASRVRALDVEGERLRVEGHGASDVELTGRVDHLRAQLTGACHVHGRGLGTRRASLELSGASDLDLTGGEDVTGEASGASTVRVWGPAPRLAIETTGASSVRWMR